VIADSSLNAAFLGVALRVAAGKLVTELDTAQPAPRPLSVSTQIPIAAGSSNTGRIPLAEPPRPDFGRSGIGWSGSTATGTGSGVGGGSDVAVADTASSVFLSACTKALAASVGPMAKVFVKEAVRRVCGERPFSRADVPALLAHLASTIEDNDDRASFQRATRAL
jgi:hypothetical protein